MYSGLDPFMILNYVQELSTFLSFLDFVNKPLKK